MDLFLIYREISKKDVTLFLETNARDYSLIIAFGHPSLVPYLSAAAASVCPIPTAKKLRQLIASIMLM
jgi:hypothetical protein